MLSDQVLERVPIMIRRLDGRIEQWSQRMQQLYAYSADEALGKVAHILLKTVFPRPLAEIEEEVRHTGRWRGELEETGAKGDRIVVASEWSLLKDAPPNSEAILIFNTDITSHSRDLAEVQFLANLVKESQDAIISKDLSGIITSWNQSAEQMFGYTANEIIGQSILRLFPPDRIQEEETILSKLRAGHRIDHYETVRLRKDGEAFEISLTLSPIRDRTGNIIGASKIVRDISKQARLQARLEEVQTELLHVSRLNDMSQMAAGLAHELNQPLSAAASYLAATKKLIEAGELVKALDGCAKASSQVLRAGEVIRRLRDFIRKTVTEKQFERLRPLLEEAMSFVTAGTRPGSVQIEYDVPAEANAAFVDKIQIQQVIINLARNAIEAMTDSPKKSLRILTRQIDDEFIQVEVRDSGPGIPEVLLERMFSPFTTTKPNGMGVGLALCRTIIEAHNGSISVDNDPDGGAIFRFTLPIN